MFRITLVFFMLVNGALAQSYSCNNIFNLRVKIIKGEQERRESKSALYFLQMVKDGRYPEFAFFAEREGKVLQIFDRLNIEDRRAEMWGDREKMLREILLKFSEEKVETIVLDFNQNHTDFLALKSLLVKGVPLVRALFNTWYGVIFMNSDFALLNFLGPKKCS